MKSLFLTFALLLSGASVFAANDIVNPIIDDNTTLTAVDVTVVDDEICYTVTVTIGASGGGLSAGLSVNVSGCGNTAAEAWADLQEGLRHINPMQ